MAPLEEQVYIHYSDEDREAVKPFKMDEIFIFYDDEFEFYKIQDDIYGTYSDEELGKVIELYLLDKIKKGNFYPTKIKFHPKEEDMPWQCSRCKWIGKTKELGPFKPLGAFSSWPTCPSCGSVKIGEALWLIDGEEYPQAEMDAWEKMQQERKEKNGEIKITD